MRAVDRDGYRSPVAFPVPRPSAERDERTVGPGTVGLGMRPGDVEHLIVLAGIAVAHVHRPPGG